MLWGEVVGTFGIAHIGAYVCREVEFGPPAANARKFTVRLLDGGTRPLRARLFLHVQRATGPTGCSLVFDSGVLGKVRPVGDDVGKR